MRVGVDEAGKGPVLGSMFAAAVGIPQDDGDDHPRVSPDREQYASPDREQYASPDREQYVSPDREQYVSPDREQHLSFDREQHLSFDREQQVLPDGLDDSKRLSPERRETLDAALREHDGVVVATVAVPPSRIDAPDTDMNSLTVRAHADAVSDLASDGDSAIVDAGDTSEARFARRLREHATVDLDVTAEHGADETYDVVAAASVVAKVARDRHVQALADEHGDVGSGYPSDPTTRSFLADYVDEHGDLPPFARRSWSTCDDVLAAAEQTGLADF